MKKTLFLAIFFLMFHIVSDAQSLADVSPVARDSVFLRMVDIKNTGLGTPIKRSPVFTGITVLYEDGLLVFPSTDVQGQVIVSDADNGYILFVGDKYDGTDYLPLPVLGTGSFIVDFETTYVRYRGFLMLE